MRDWTSQSHVRWYCKYHVVFVPKYRRKALYGVCAEEGDWAGVPGALRAARSGAG